MRALFILLFCVSVSASPPTVYDSVTRDASSTNIPNAFTSAGATFLSSISPKRTRICVINDTTTNIFVCFKTSVAASCAEDDSLYVPDGGGECRDDVAIASSVYVKGTSAISSGRVHVGVW